MITIYTDGSYNSTKNIGTWGCRLIYKNKTYDYSGICTNAIDIHDCELRAIVKALGIVKHFKTRKVLIYTDRRLIAHTFNKIIRNKKVLSRVKNRNLWNLIMGYYWKRAYFSIEWINRKENVSHAMAYGRLKEISV